MAGLRFPNPVGLAAGFDKECRLAAALPCLGFGFIELGTITPRPQAGNPKPRLFRLPGAEAIINRMGFNNGGARAAAKNLAGVRAGVPVGINIGINKDVRPEDAPDEYAKVFSRLYVHGDYFTVNVSSPNTPGLRLLQEKLRMERILTRLQELNGDRKPVFVKLAPDLDVDALDKLLPLLEKNAAGVICTNTTVSTELKQGAVDEEARLSGKPAESVLGGALGPPPGGGGLSGSPLRELSTRMIREVYRRTEGRLPIIGAGGVTTAEDAYQKLCAGASLVQIYTALVYKGPGLPSAINRGLARTLKEQGHPSVADAVGRSHPEILRK